MKEIQTTYHKEQEEIDQIRDEWLQELKSSDEEDLLGWESSESEEDKNDQL